MAVPRRYSNTVSCFVYLVSDVRDMVNTADCCDGFLGVFRNGAVQPEFGALHVVSVGAGTRGFGEGTGLRTFRPCSQVFSWCGRGHPQFRHVGGVVYEIDIANRIGNYCRSSSTAVANGSAMVLLTRSTTLVEDVLEVGSSQFVTQRCRNFGLCSKRLDLGKQWMVLSIG